MAISEEVLYKTALKMSVSKLTFKAQKMRTLNKQSLSSISKELKELAGGKGQKFDRGLTMSKIRIAKLVTDDNTADVYETLVVDCELMLSKLGRLLSVRHDRKTGEVSGGDATVKRLAAKMMFTSNYIEIKEFKKLATMLANKFGRAFYEEAVSGYGEGPDWDDSAKDFARKCKGEDVDELTDKYLEEFCDAYRIDLYGEGKYEEEEEEKQEVEEAKESEEDKPDTKPSSGTDIDDLKKRFEALKRL